MNNYIFILVIFIVDVSVVFLFNFYVGLCSCYNRIFSFGDDIMDTGNFIYLIGKVLFKYKEVFYGKMFFSYVTGRISDGRVFIDFYGAYFFILLLNFFWVKVIYLCSFIFLSLNFSFE